MVTGIQGIDKCWRDGETVEEATVIMSQAEQPEKLSEARGCRFQR